MAPEYEHLNRLFLQSPPHETLPDFPFLKMMFLPVPVIPASSGIFLGRKDHPFFYFLQFPCELLEK